VFCQNEDEIVSINGVRTDRLTHSDAVQLIQNSSSPLVLLMRQATHAQSPDHTTGNSTATGKLTCAPFRSVSVTNLTSPNLISFILKFSEAVSSPWLRPIRTQAYWTATCLRRVTQWRGSVCELFVCYTTVCLEWYK